MGLVKGVDFKILAREAATFCQERVIKSQSLRSNELQPSNSLFVNKAILDDDDFVNSTSIRFEMPGRRCELVEGLARSRTRLLTYRSQELLKPPSEFIIYVPGCCLNDGFAKAHSSGFFDVNDTPPWDTWICYMDDPLTQNNGGDFSYLISYVPTARSKCVDDGIENCPTDCIQRANNVKWKEIYVPPWLLEFGFKHCTSA